MSNVLHKYRAFTPDNYDKEEQFLREMSLKGWHFDSFTLIKYTFIKGQPKSYSYKLDFRKDYKDDKENYAAIHNDLGWEKFYEFNIFGGTWVYFRKESETGEDDMLFTDNESKIDLLLRIKKFYLLIMFIMLCINMVNIVIIYNLFMLEPVVASLLMIPLILIIILYAKIQARISVKIKKLKRMQIH